MKTTFDKAYILANRGCYSREKVLALSFINNETVTINDILNSEIPLRHKGWFVVHKCGLDYFEQKKLQLNLALLVLPIFEEEYPNDRRVRDYLKISKGFILGIEKKDADTRIRLYHTVNPHRKLENFGEFEGADAAAEDAGAFKVSYDEWPAAACAAYAAYCLGYDYAADAVIRSNQREKYKVEYIKTVVDFFTKNHNINE